MASEEECLWSFGYGSNMDVKALESKKDVKVLGKSNLLVYFRSKPIDFDRAYYCTYSNICLFG